MTTDDGRAQARLVALAGPREGPGGPGGGVAAVGAAGEVAGAGGAGEGLRAAAEHRSRRALRAAGARYAAEHGGDVPAGQDSARHDRDRWLGGPGAVPRRRWLTTPRVALVALAALGLLTAVVVVRVLAPPAVLVSAAGAEGAAAGGATAGAAGDPLGVPDDAAGDDAAAVEVAAAGGSAGEVVVHVVGEVARPGVVKLAAGARVVDAVDAVGGATAAADLGSLNLARVLVDGEQVVVPATGGTTPAPSTGSPVAADPRVDLNAADVAQLDGLPGIGPVLAERVVAWREEHGRFSTVDELGEVSGIGPAVLEGLRDLVRV